MSYPCKGEWHEYPDCDGCPMLGDSCDGSEEWNEREDEDHRTDEGLVANAKWAATKKAIAKQLDDVAAIRERKRELDAAKEVRHCKCGKPITDSTYSKLCASCYNEIEDACGDHHQAKARKVRREWGVWADDHNSRGDALLYNT